MSKKDPLDSYVPPYKNAEEASRIFILPNAFTAGNLFFGFLAIIWCIRAKYGEDVNMTLTPREYYQQAVWFILIAFACDGLDGRVARLGGKESLFGMEFDSIADVVSFGIAPSLMVIFLILSPFESYPMFQQLSLLIGFIYLLCAAVRLARFNVITSPLLPPDNNSSSKHNFRGLPVPAAAGMVASLVLVLNEHDLQKLNVLLPILLLLIAGLMISNIPFPSFKKIDWQTQVNLPRFILLFTILATVFFFKVKSIFLCILFLSYIFYGFFGHLFRKARKKSVNN